MRPDIFFRKHLQQEFAVDAHIAVAHKFRQVLHAQRPAIILVAQRLEGAPQITEERLLERGQFFYDRVGRPEAHSFDQHVDGFAPRIATGEGVEEIRDRLFTLAPEGDAMYPPDFYTDQSPDFRISEIVREKAIALTRQEVPHSLYVRMEDLEMRDDGATLWARGFLFVERESQKGILVGKSGDKIKAVVREAERELAEIFPYAVKLDMRVKVDHEWRKKDPLLRRLIQ